MNKYDKNQKFARYNLDGYNNNMFYKHGNKGSIRGFFFIKGVVGLYRPFQLFFTYPEKIILDGKIGSGVIQLFFGLLFFSISTTYFIRAKINKRNKDLLIDKEVFVAELTYEKNEP